MFCSYLFLDVSSFSYHGFFFCVTCQSLSAPFFFFFFSFSFFPATFIGFAIYFPINMLQILILLQIKILLSCSSSLLLYSFPFLSKCHLFLTLYFLQKVLFNILLCTFSSCCFFLCCLSIIVFSVFLLKKQALFYFSLQFFGPL